MVMRAIKRNVQKQFYGHLMTIHKKEGNLTKKLLKS